MSIQEDSEVNGESANSVDDQRDPAEELTTANSRIDQLSRELFTAKVKALGLLHDPSDMPYDADLLDDDKLTAAVQELLTSKPHWAKQVKPPANVGQGIKNTPPAEPTGFASLFG